ncbi:MAG TPA: MFS transporter [Candidatus Binatia bacterium]|jgi:EmrB/QacA subfamily drug resistance transporter
MSQIAPPSNSRWTSKLILLNVCIGQAIVGLDQRALLVALPTLTESFHTAFTTIQWTLLIYDLILIGLVITMGRLGDLFGRRRFYSLGFLLFVIGSALCGIAQSPGQLIAFRALQAVGGSMISANGRAIASVTFREERGKALGLTSMAFHIGFLTGPSLGGFLIDSVGWRWIFYINVPIGLWGAYLAWKIMAETRADEKEVSIDFLGAFFLLLTNCLFIYAIDQLPRLGWSWSVVVGLCLSAVSLALLVFAERRSKTPILDLSSFRSRLFTAGILSLLFVALTQSAINFLLPFYLQSLLGFSPYQVGWLIVADSAVIMIMAPVAGWLSDRFGSRLLSTLGCSIIVIGQFLLAYVGLHSSIAAIIFPLALWGLGWGLFNSPNQSAIFGSVSPNKIGVASGMTATTARTGGALGVAMGSALFAFMLSSAGISQSEIESPQSWSATPERFIAPFSHTIHIINLFSLLAVLFSAIRGPRQE